MRFVVTGAAGFIGSHVAERLTVDGHDVVAVDCFTDYYDRALKQRNASGLNLQQVDLCVEDIDLSGCDAVFHLAGHPGARSFVGFQTHLRQNTWATQRIFEAAAAAKARVIWASSSSVYGDSGRYPTPESAPCRPESPYGVSKLACEHLQHAYAEAYGLDAVALRYFTVYGPRQRPDMAFARAIEAAIRGTTLQVYGDGTQTRSFTFIDDAVDATVRALSARPGIYNVGGKDASLMEALATLERVASRPLSVAHELDQAGDLRRTAADTTLIFGEIGWEPSTPLQEGLRRHWEWRRTVEPA